MQNYIISIVDRVKEEIKKKGGAGCSVEIGFVGYKDHCDGVNSLGPIRGLTTDIPSVKAVISSCVASGGGDTPEYLLGGMKTCAAFSWKAEAAKFLFVVADAPCHGKQFHSCDDSCPAGDPTGERADVILRDLCMKEVKFIMCHVSRSLTQQMFNEFQRLAPAHDPSLLGEMDLGCEPSAFCNAISNQIIERVSFEFL